MIYQFGTAPDQAKDGYAIEQVVLGTDEEMRERFKGQDVRLVRGAWLHGRPGAYEFAVMAKVKTAACATISCEQAAA